MSLSQQSIREIPIVIVRISKFSSWIIMIVSRMSLVFSIVYSLYAVHGVEDILMHYVDLHSHDVVC